ncbi:MAG: peptidoglycan DD-metalloendopeptidase family protein [Oscillospiraceae bacterium]|nr:peptidoglycan DD-metalloendopeptidase family protein [Oscillospiraceae bacterium]
MSIKPAENEKAGFDSAAEYLYLRIYEFFYITGIRFIRQVRGGYHFAARQIRYIKSETKEWFLYHGRRIYSSIRNLLVGKYHAFLSYSNKAADAFDVLRKSKESSKEQQLAAIKDVFSCWGLLVWKIFCTIFNYVAPVLALVFLVVTIQYFSALQYGLAFESNGKTLAYIADETVYNKAEQIIRSRTSAEISDIEKINPGFAVVPVSSLELTEPEELANIILGSSGQSVYEGYGLYIDDEFVGSTDEADNLLALLDEYREQFREEGDTESKLQFKQKLALVDGVYPTSSIMAISEFRQLLNSEIEGEKYHTVSAGESPSLIADMYDLYYQELVAMNPALQDNPTIRVGQELVVSKSVSYLNVTTTRREVYTEEVPFPINKTPSDKYYNTYSKVTKKGVPGEQLVTALVTYEDGMAVSRQVLATELLKEPVAQEMVVGTKNPIYAVGNASGTSKGFIWPTNKAGAYVSCGIWGYKGHTGTDITGTGHGSNIYASAAGTVVTAKSGRTGYGNYIIINHGDGITTLYAHCSKLYVKVGQYVNQGDIIAAMGSTGNSTGTHLHFEIRINGQYMNPLNYISK